MEINHLDQITALPNHLFFSQILNKALAQAKRHHRKLALLFIDVDNFARIHEAHGLANSNRALEELGRRFRSILRLEDSLARLEKDEFAILITDIEHPKSLGPVVDKLLKISADPIDIAAQTIHLTVSIGIALFPDDGQALEALEKSADLALDQAKHSGGGHYQFYTPQMKMQAKDYIELQNALQQALDNHEFLLHYQPKLNLKEKKITGVEALIRWDHPHHGLLSPSKFLPIAEETGFIIPLGEWILREACHANKEWQQQGYQPISMSINLSPEQFHHPRLTQVIEDTLQETGLEACYLDLEITEMTVMDDTSRINEFLKHIQAKGITLSMDDFGTGHTAIRYLKDFPINTLKIDQSFIKSLPEDHGNASITSNMIRLAHELKIKVVAEGVETTEQLEFLAKLHCDLAQGYFISRPLPASKLVALLEKA